MIDTEQFKDKKVLILGLGKSGLNAALLLNQLGTEVIVNEVQDLTDSEYLKMLDNLDIYCVHGKHDTLMLDKTFDFVLKSPGIPYENEMIKKAQELDLPIITDVELAYRLGEAEIIGITGTNGKTTTTTLIAEVLNADTNRQGQAYVAGNIGVPVSEVVQKATKADEIVMELSSFQLMGIEEFKPNIAVILNIYSAHLDYHHTREAYIEAKAKIIKNLSKDDYFIYNADQIDVAKLSELTDAKAVPFSRTNDLKNGVCLRENDIYAFDEFIINKSDVVLKGEHNLENVLATIAVAKLKNIDNETIVHVLKHFSGIKHRLQYVDTIQERKFYNDTKATNSQSTKFAVEGFDQPIILLAGGLDREEDLTELINPFQKHVKAIIVSGENRKAFIEIGEKSGIESIHQVDSMKEAVHMAFNESAEGDVILLSPASASWDQYKNFEERGDEFINEVNELKEEVLK